MRTIGNIPTSFSPEEQAFLQTLIDAVKTKQPSVVPPAPPTNLKATAGPGINIVQFTRSDGDTYALYRSTQPSLNGATRIDLGRANHYTDNVGAAGVLVFYWILAKTGQQQSIVVGPVKQTTLALTASVTPPAPPAGSQTPARSDTDNQIVPGHPSQNTYQEDL
jgi:hypothetical protein